jgi:Xaa-Pro aminopeptidase
MPKLFRVCRGDLCTGWRVLLADQTYGEYLDKNDAVLDAMEAAAEARHAGHTAEVWDGAVRVF